MDLLAPRPGVAPLVGQDLSLAAVAAAFEASRGGGARVVLLTGEPGAGKSRLLDEVATRLRSEGALVLAGFALDAGEAAPPFFPLARALAPVLEGRPPVALAPDQLPVLAASGIARGPVRHRRLAELDPRAERLRTFDALSQLLAALAASRLFAVVLDDLQWAAPILWEALVYVTRTLGQTGACLLLAAREEVLHDSSAAAAAAIVELNRQRRLTLLALPPLAASDLGRLAEGLLGGPPSEALVRLLAARSEGNPFFAEEILIDLAERGWLEPTAGGWRVRPGVEAGMPLTLRLALGARLGRLAPEAVRAVAAAAVLGRSFTERALGAMIGVDRDELGGMLAPAVSAGVIDSEAGEGWRFRHDVIQEAALELAGPKRARLHAAAAVALAAEASDDRALLAAVARHWRLAGEPGLAAEAATGAARAAMAAQAHGEALELARVARRMGEEAEAGRRPTAELAQAMRLHGEAALAGGEYGEAEAALRAALGVARELEDRDLQGAIWSRLGGLHRRRESPEEAAGCLETALGLVEGRPEAGRLEAEVLVELAGLNGLSRGRYQEAEAQGRRAIALAAAHADPRLEARATLALADARARARGGVAARPLLERALERALAADDPGLAAEACASLATSHYWSGELGASERFARRRLQLAERAADVFGLRHAHSWLALVACSRGDWGEARRLLGLAEPALLRLASPEPIAFLRIVQGLVWHRLGVLEQAAAHYSEALERLDRADSATVVWYAGLLGLAYAAQGAVEDAERILARQEERLARLAPDALPARSARTVQGLAYATLGDRRRGATCEALLRPHGSDFHWWPAKRTLAALAELRGDRAGALEDLADLVALCRREALRPDLALALLRLAELEPDPAARSEALRLQGELGMHPEPSSGAGSGKGAAAPYGRLTAREQEVLRLVTLGMTNREIAQALFISERTVVNHLGHVFGKLGVENRAGATAYALRNRLA